MNRQNVYTSRCKQCIKSRTKTWRKAEGKQRYKDYDTGRVHKNKLYLQEERSKRCEKYNKNRHYIIDFYHIDPANKSITMGATNRWTRTQLETEIKKCIRLCRNCHSELHYLEKNTIFNFNEWINSEK